MDCNKEEEEGAGMEDDDLLPNPGLPISFPLTSLHRLLDRSYFSSFHFPYNKSSVPLPPKAAADRPRLLVCHDLKGGYQDDKWVQGSSNSGAYSLWHWGCVDVFVYFSHNLVTIPPPGWVNAAHKHGVQVLGTFITEWEEGEKICQSLLESEESAQMYALRLAELAQALGFDGWLINIENKIRKDQIGNLIQFVKHLTISMHTLVPSSLVIWYDAVTIDGELDWQNCLNNKNYEFFDACDGVFINYTWKEEYAKVSAIAARHRAFDVYMGVDVFGRNTFGGGGFNSNIALKVAQEAGVSAALFAIAWVYETNQSPNFQEAEDRWWGTIEACWNYVNRNQLKFPFFSDFNEPRICLVKASQESPFHVSLSSEDAIYGGGSSLRFVGSVQIEEICVVELFPSQGILIGAPLNVSYSVLLGPSSQFCLVLKLQHRNNNRFIFLTGQNSIEVVKEAIDLSRKPYLSFKYREVCHDIMKVDSSKLDQNISAMSRGLKPDNSVEKSGWYLRQYFLELHECSLTNIYAVSHISELDYKKALQILEGNTSQGYSLSSISNDQGPCKLDTAENGKDIRSNRKIMSEIAPLVASGKSKRYYALLGHIRATSPSKDCFCPLKSCKFHASIIEWLENSEGARFTSLELKWVFDNQIDSLPRNIAKQDCACNESSLFVHYNVYFRPAYIVKNEAELEARKCDGVDYSKVQLRYLGAAFVQAFYVNFLPVPNDCNLLHFWLQPFCECGLAQDLKESPLCAVEVPSENSNVWKLNA
ncbi:hypothetical protein O6H91_01G054600 [Diphasiastrum complanatum]|uniref:Uncharacterized protein n=1 Tax=Diphasiastrum complanatum TaxID=34168 RepID=A0ACC2ER32_DIPCM|nr:hypothetical protein O6H91_01G054600 [Diphasiastrum complanatum]